MGNHVGKLRHCFTAGNFSGHNDPSIILTNTSSNNHLGHSFCYFPPCTRMHEDNNSLHTTTFKSISGASVSANSSTQSSTSLTDMATHSYNSFYSIASSASFESSTSFASLPLLPVQRSLGFSGCETAERRFLSGPIESKVMSGTIERGIFSCPIEKISEDQLPVSVSSKGFSLKGLRRVAFGKISKGCRRIVSNIRGRCFVNNDHENAGLSSGELASRLSSNVGDNADVDWSMKSRNLQWAEGKAGEDRVHIVIPEQHGWVFVGIYDGFNGPDAPDYLIDNLYNAVHKELKGLLWNDKFESRAISLASSSNSGSRSHTSWDSYQSHMNNSVGGDCTIVKWDAELDISSKRMKKTNLKIKGLRIAAKKWREHRMTRKSKSDKEKNEIEKLEEEFLGAQGKNGPATTANNHQDFLSALAESLRKTEDSYLDMADKKVIENPELALMGSCVLVMLMKGEDVYLMNVGDSRAVLAQKFHQDTEIVEVDGYRASESGELNNLDTLASVQLTMDHSTYVEEEVQRIMKEHPDDTSAILNDRVKGYLKVTRAFGAGFLKQPKWNDALLEIFRLDYVGSSPYITCLPTLCHHRLGPRDRFLIVSSDGLYQYFTNEEAVSEVQSFISSFPEGDPAQHLIEEVLFRAAKKHGMDFHELLAIPHGDRRRYHDDVSIIIISFDRRIWRSSV